VKLKDWDHPVLLLFFVTLGVIATTSILSAVAQHFGWTGLLGLLKGGVAPQAQNETAP
jgi:hypothetical protein